MTDAERDLLLFIALRLQKLYAENNNPKQARTIGQLRGNVFREQQKLKVVQHD